MKTVRIDSDFSYHARQMSARTAAEIKAEPMLYSADRAFALEHGGPITREFIELLDLGAGWEEPNELVIDSRVHMLMPGWYPCIPGWHVDDASRATRKDGQPDHFNPFNPEHCLTVVDASDKPTGAMPEFWDGVFDLPEPEDGSGLVTYKLWDDVLQARPWQMQIEIDSGDVVYFNARTLHRGMPATSRGWRFFIRATKNRGKKDPSEIRRQVNVYMPAINGGW